MRTIYKLLTINFLTILLLGCLADGSGGISGTSEGGSDDTVELDYAVEGDALKGPFKKGAIVEVFALSPSTKQLTLIQTTEISSDKGELKLQAKKGLYLLRVTGEYFNEVNLNALNDQVVLNTIFEIVDKEIYVSVNLLSHLAHTNALTVFQSPDNTNSAKQVIIQSEKRILNAFKELSGEVDIVKPLNQLNFYSNSTNSRSLENAYLLYLSALTMQIVESERDIDPQFMLMGFLDTLQSEINETSLLSENQLQQYQTAHKEIDLGAVKNNLATVLTNENLADAIAIETQVTDGIAAPSNFSVEHINSVTPPIFRFFYEGSSDDKKGGVLGAEFSTMFLYTIQISQLEDFSNIEIIYTTNDNFYDASTADFPSTDAYYARVRKSSPNGQLSEWSDLQPFSKP